MFHSNLFRHCQLANVCCGMDKWLCDSICKNKCTGNRLLNYLHVCTSIVQTQILRMLLKNNRRLIITLQRQLNGWWIIEWDKGLKWDPIQLVDDVSFHLEPRGAVFYKQILVETALSFEGHFIASWKSNGSQTKNNAWVLQCTYHCNVVCLSELLNSGQWEHACYMARQIYKRIF